MFVVRYSEHAEADTFFCFTNLMSENRDNFIKSLDDSQCGITYKMESVYSMLKDKDLELYLKLVRLLHVQSLLFTTQQPSCCQPRLFTLKSRLAVRDFVGFQV